MIGGAGEVNRAVVRLERHAVGIVGAVAAEIGAVKNAGAGGVDFGQRDGVTRILGRLIGVGGYREGGPPAAPFTTPRNQMLSEGSIAMEKPVLQKAARLVTKVLQTRAVPAGFSLMTTASEVPPAKVVRKAPAVAGKVPP